MKIKKEANSRSPLLRVRNPRNSSNLSEQCEPWYTTVPSISYIWTHRPQWRRRHKNGKKAKTIPLTLINSGANAENLWNTSRSSISPYETRSSRLIVGESGLIGSCGGKKNREVHGWTSNQRKHSSDRGGSVFQTRSDSGLRRPGGRRLLRPIRSQRRLGAGNSANSQNTVGTPSSLQVNGSERLIGCRDSRSDYSIHKRRVTFSNYVSENSATDTRSRISAIIMNDNEPSEASWWRRSYVRFTDDEDNCSMQTDLSCLISSIIFDDSESSFYSLTSARNSSVPEEKSEIPSNREISESLFYVNSSYSNGSSCNLLSLSVGDFSTDDFTRSNRLSFLVQPSCNDAEDYGREKMIEKFRTEPACDFTEKNSQENMSQSDEIILNVKISGETKTEPLYNRNPDMVAVVSHKLRQQLSESNDSVPDMIIPEGDRTDPTHSGVECITIQLKDISSSVKEISIESRRESDNPECRASKPTNLVPTDTSELITLNLIPLLDPTSELSKNHVNNGRLSVGEIFDFLQRPAGSPNASFILDQFMQVGRENDDATNEFDDIGGRKSKESMTKIDDQVDLLRIDTETCGQFESVLIEMKDFDEDLESNEISEEKSCLQIRNCLREPRESLVVNLNGSSDHSRLVESSPSHFHNDDANCLAGDKCCTICGRRKMDSTRYVRPVCRVKGGNSSPQLENDPWTKVMKKVAKHENRNELIEAPRRIDSASSANKDATNEVPPLIDEISEAIEEKEENRENLLDGKNFTEADDSSPSITAPDDSNIPPSRAERSTSRCRPELRSSTSFGKSYFTRKSARTVEGTSANRLLCVISESDSLTAVPPFLPKKAPYWLFGRRMPMRRCSRR